MFRSWYAIGIGTGLGLVLHSNAATAQDDFKQHARAAYGVLGVSSRTQAMTAHASESGPEASGGHDSNC